MWEVRVVCWKMRGCCNLAIEMAKLGAGKHKIACRMPRKVVRKFLEGIERL